MGQIFSNKCIASLVKTISSCFSNDGKLALADLRMIMKDDKWFAIIAIVIVAVVAVIITCITYFLAFIDLIQVPDLRLS